MSLFKAQSGRQSAIRPSLRYGICGYLVAGCLGGVSPNGMMTVVNISCLNTEYAAVSTALLFDLFNVCNPKGAAYVPTYL